MRVGDLMSALRTARLLHGGADTEISSVEIDSRSVEPGALFCCLIGATDDGHGHARQAIERGATAVLSEHDLGIELPDGVAEVRVRPGEGRAACAVASDLVAGRPASDLRLIGVTGTNGKTTVVSLLSQLLSRGGFASSVIGTLSGGHTTPAAPELHRRLAAAKDRARTLGLPGAVAIEVSSHGLDQGRVLGLHFDVGVFTNLSHDHLDYHGTMEAYFEAKTLLFEPATSAMAVIWTGSPEGQAMAARRRGDVREISFADLTDLKVGPRGSAFTWRSHAIELPLAGRPNVINAVLAAEAAVAIGLDPALVAVGLRDLTPVRGRMEVVSGGGHGQPEVLVDFAHTPDALSGALEIARELAGPNRLAVVFGCGGDRDPSKRSSMGQVAAQGADLVWITNDNPRSEDPAVIAEAVRAGARGPAVIHLELDRALAVAQAIAATGPGDVVLIAGKGHETTQIFATQTVAFDDVEVARRILEGGAPC